MKKPLISFLFLLTCIQNIHAQKIEKFFDYQWKECDASRARFFALIQYTDSGWLRYDYFLAEKKLQMKGLYKDSSFKITNGVFYYYHPNGVLKSTGRYVDNKKEGLWISLHPNQYMSDSTMYDSGNPTGISLQWYTNGFISDSTNYKTGNATVSVSWFDDGTVSSAGHLTDFRKYNGKWQFFHRNGNLSAAEEYDNGKLIDKKYFAEDGSAMADTTNRTAPAKFPGGLEGWQKYLESKLFFPPNYQFVNGDKAIVVVDFVVDENGNVKDVNLQTPFHPAFDDIAIKVIKNSPRWLPAMNHNRKVKYHHRQGVSFVQDRDGN